MQTGKKMPGDTDGHGMIITAIIWLKELLCPYMETWFPLRQMLQPYLPFLKIISREILLKKIIG